MAAASNPHLSDAPAFRRIILMALPMIGGLLSTMTFSLVDTYFIARLGTEPLAAVGYTNPFMMLVFSFAIGLGAGTSSGVSAAVGRGDRREVRRLCSDCLILAAGVGVVVTVAGWLILDPVFAQLGAGPGAMTHIRPYMHVWLVSVVLLMVTMLGNNCIQASGDTRTSGLILFIGAVLNAGLDPIFIFGWGPIPAMGIAGASTATLVGRAVTAAISLYVLGRRKKMLSPKLPSLRELLTSWKDVLQVGIPASATSLLFPFSLGVITRLIAQYGDGAVAAAGAGQRVESFVMLVFWSTSWVITPFAGQNNAAGRYDQVDQAQRFIRYLSLGWGALCFVVLLWLADPLAGLFGKSERVERVLIHYIWISSAGLGFRGATVLAAAFFNGLKRPGTAAAIDILRMFVLAIPLAWLGSYLDGPQGVFAGVAIAHLLSGLTAMVIMHRACRTCRDLAGDAAEDTRRTADEADDGGAENAASDTSPYGKVPPGAD
jgi:putative MATE family efflux protein